MHFKKSFKNYRSTLNIHIKVLELLPKLNYLLRFAWVKRKFWVCPSIHERVLQFLLKKKVKQINHLFHIQSNPMAPIFRIWLIIYTWSLPRVFGRANDRTGFWNYGPHHVLKVVIGSLHYTIMKRPCIVVIILPLVNRGFYFSSLIFVKINLD